MPNPQPTYELKYLVNYGKKLLKCRQCERSFKDQTSLLTHERRHTEHNSRHLKCPECARVFTSTSTLRVHRQSFHREEFKQNRGMENGTREVKCNLCDQTFQTYAELHTHQTRRFINNACPRCEYVACSVRDLNLHLQQHARHRCSQCNMVFESTSSVEYQEHIRTAHLPVDAEPSTSVYYDDTQHPFDMEEETVVTHDVEEEVIVDDMTSIPAPKREDNGELLAGRRVSPLPESIPPRDSYACTYCDKVFKFAVHYRRHVQKKCEHCNLSFKWCSAKQRHQATHYMGDVGRHEEQHVHDDQPVIFDDPL